VCVLFFSLLFYISFSLFGLNIKKDTISINIIQIQRNKNIKKKKNCNKQIRRKKENKNKKTFDRQSNK
jgi:predicted membrane protein